MLKSEGFLAAGLALFGNNAYVTNKFMVTPFKFITSPCHDDFNFYQSQLRIVIEQALGILVHRWGLLHRPLSNKFGMKKQISLVLAMCKLHNFIIDNTVNEVEDMNVPEPSARDLLYLVHNGGGLDFSEDSRPISLLSDTIDDTKKRNIPRGSDVIRQMLKRSVEERGLCYPLIN